MYGKISKRKKGITMISLVVTIVVLLILAGVTISMTTGQNGVINRTKQAKQETEKAETKILLQSSVSNVLAVGKGKIKEEKLKSELNNNFGEGKYEISGDATNGWKIVLQGVEYQIGSDGKITTETSKEDEGVLPTGEGTRPYLPNDKFTYKEGDLSKGLVIIDENENEYVWVEVPKTTKVYKTAGINIKDFTIEEYQKIAKDLKTYTEEYSSSNCGDTNSVFMEQYKAMLKSVYTNGGFWIGRYEAGLETGKRPRNKYIKMTEEDRAVTKQNMIPYNFITRDDAQILAQRMNYDGCISSLIFGVQWDLMLKYIETKAVKENKILTTDSITIGNYYNGSFEINRGKFAQYGLYLKWYDYSSNERTDLIENCKKKAQTRGSNGTLLTTGALDMTKLQNIYDIAGNVWEWTLEFCTVEHPCVRRGGSYVSKGKESPAKDRNDNSITDTYGGLGFRIGIWK